MRRYLNVVLLAFPLAAAAQSDHGCWVHAFAGENFRAPLTTYTGPRHEPVFMDEARSVIVGPNASLVGYDGSRYRKQTLDLPPGARVSDLASIGFHRRVDSFQVVCTG